MNDRAVGSAVRRTFTWSTLLTTLLFDIAGPLLTYWNANGGLRMFGYPITEAYMGKNPTDGKDYVQQYYQRARLEWHKEFAGTENEVLLGLLGSEQLGNNVCK